MISALAILNRTVIPIDTVVSVGDSTTLGCNGAENFTWSHKPLEGKSEQYFYKNKNISPRYRDLGFRMERKREFGEWILVVENVTNAVAGRYKCDDVAQGRVSLSAEGEIIVLGEMLYSILLHFIILYYILSIIICYKTPLTFQHNMIYMYNAHNALIHAYIIMLKVTCMYKTDDRAR